MIVQEVFEIGGKSFIRTYSDAGRFVVRDNIPYSEACDPAELGRTYIEGDLLDPIIIEDDYSEAGRILMGVES